MRQALKFLGMLAGAAALAAVLPGLSSAQDRYATPPPLVVSPDLTAPWVLQLRPEPQSAPRYRQVVRPRYERVSTPHHYARRTAMPEPQRIERREVIVPAPSAAPDLRNSYVVPTVRNGQRTAMIVPMYTPRQMSRQLAPQFLPQEVTYHGGQKPGTIVIDTKQRFLYLVGKNGTARRYGVGVGADGFRWTGVHKITRKAEWPGWTPPTEMIAREKAKGRVLPAHMVGGIANPLGARALYIGSTLYRIHGTNAPWTIGHFVSSGCIRMRNQDVMDLYGRVPVGATVVVM